MADTIIIETPVATVLEVSGKQGPQGVPGATGATGATGPQGPAGTGIETLTTKGDLLSRNDSAAIRVGIGSTGQVLKVASTGLPAWENESGGVPTSRTISAGTGLTGGGDLTANRTLAVSFGSSAGTACEGNDARLSDARTPSSTLAHAASHFAGVKASFYGQVAGMTQNVILRANTVGTAGNSITLVFDGVTELGDIVSTWNGDNPSNQVTLVVGNNGDIPDSGEEITLSGGVAAGSDPFKNINQNLGNTDAPQFDKLGLGEPASGTPHCKLSVLGDSDTQPVAIIKGAQWFGSVDGNQGVLYQGDIAGKLKVIAINSDFDEYKTLELVSDGDTFTFPANGGTLATTGDIPANTIASTIVDAKGDLIVGTAADTVARLPVGATNGHVLTVDSAEASGMKWAAASGGVTSVSGSAPIVSSGGTTPTISVTTGTTAGTVAAGDDSRITGAAQKSANLSDLASASTARTNLGLGTAATAATGDFAAASHTHGASDISSGTVAVARLPIFTYGAGGQGLVPQSLGGQAGQFLKGDGNWTSVTASDVGLGNVSNTAQVTSVTGTAPIVSSGGTTPAISISAATTSAAGSMSAADKTKLDGIATGATANSSDATLLNRANHTGTQAAGTITGLAAIATSGSASDLGSGTVPTARLASGTANSSTFLRGDQTWASVTAGVSAVGASTADVLSVSGSDLVADDGGTIDSADPFIKWDDTNSKLVYANPLSRPSGAFYVGLAPTTTALGTNSVNIQSGRDNAAHVAKDASSVCVGYGARSTASLATAIGHNAVCGNGSFAGGGTATATGDAVAIGYASNAGASGTAVGRIADVGNTGGVAVGYLTSVTGTYGVAIGYGPGAANLRAQFVTRPFNAVYWGGTTTDATANVVLNMDATATNRFTIAANTMVVADILIAANSTASGKASFWHYHVAIRRDGSNNTALVGAAEQIGTTQTVGSPSGWSVALTADDTNEALQLAVTGEASTSITWRATAFYRLV